MPNGRDAFCARVALIEAADRTLDLQYYIFRNDATGALIVDRLIAAADRGVRVRVLLDDWGTIEKNDEALAGLDSHENIEIRLFNPYIGRSPLRRLAELLTRFSRVNRRMHNKQLIADGRAAVLGGRNIGDEYFDLGELHFQDIDVLAVGPVAAESQASFDAYWDSEYAVPMAAIRRYEFDAALFRSKRADLSRRVAAMRDSAYARALADSAFMRALRDRALDLHWASGTVMADPPAKVSRPAGTEDDTYLGARLTAHARNAKTEMLVVSAYFVPGVRGVQFFSEAVRRGAGVRILTNSLAATDVWLVHSAYRNYRRALLGQGVRLYELKPLGQLAAGIKVTLGSSRSSLHAKTFVLDRRAAFIGSVNLDPRSLAQNTEVGVLVQCPELACEVAALFERWSSPDLSYEVALADGSHLRWTGRAAGRSTEFRDEPEAGFWRRLGARLFSLLPIESQI